MGALKIYKRPAEPPGALRHRGSGVRNAARHRARRRRPISGWFTMSKSVAIAGRQARRGIQACVRQISPVAWTTHASVSVAQSMRRRWPSRLRPGSQCCDPHSLCECAAPIYEEVLSCLSTGPSVVPLPVGGGSGPAAGL